MKLMSDVLVIGAGPAGSTVSKIIAEHGFDVLLIEKDDQPGKTNICAGGMPESTFNETGLNSEVIETKIIGAKHYYPWGLSNRALNQVTVSRLVFDKHLAERAVNEGVKLMCNTLIKDVSINNDGVIAFFDDSTIKSKLIVFADGPNTLGYRKFGLGFNSESDNTFLSIACEVEWNNNKLNEYEFYYGYDFLPWGYGWIFPKKNSINVGVGCFYGMLSSNLIDSLEYLFQKHPMIDEKLKERKILWQGSALIPSAPAKRIYGERVLVVGDAAGMVDPILGGGIPHAISGGKIAGDMCVRSLEANDFSSKFLSQYQAIWHKSANYYNIKNNYLLSNIFLYLTKFDKNAYSKLAVSSKEGIIKSLLL